jgi:tetratricopeptide (TPR) repeat protein
MDFNKLNFSTLPDHVQCDRLIIKQLIEANNEEEIKLVMEKAFASASEQAKNDLKDVLNILDPKTQKEMIESKTASILFNIPVALNLLGKELEKEGEIDFAIKLYEINLLNNFIGSHPYNRLSIIYRKKKMHSDVIRVLEKAVYVFENVVYRDRSDRSPKLEKYKKALDKARQVMLTQK